MSERLHLQLGPADLRVTYELLIYIYIYIRIFARTPVRICTEALKMLPRVDGSSLLCPAAKPLGYPCKTWL